MRKIIKLFLIAIICVALSPLVLADVGCEERFSVRDIDGPWDINLWQNYNQGQGSLNYRGTWGWASYKLKRIKGVEYELGVPYSIRGKVCRRAGGRVSCEKIRENAWVYICYDGKSLLINGEPFRVTKKG
jgi:hypothetical protein